MKYQMNGIGRSPLLAASILLCGLFAAGGDDHNDVIRDPNIPVVKGSTLAWKPAPPPKVEDLRPCGLRHVISRGETVARDAGPDNINRPEPNRRPLLQEPSSSAL